MSSHLVTRQYEDLRGGVLRAAIAPIVIVAGLAGDLMGRSAMLLALGLIVVSVLPLVSRWLDGRFGRVVSGARYQALRDGTTRAVLAPCFMVASVIFEHFSPLAEGVILVVAVMLLFGPMGLSRWLDQRFGVVRGSRLYPLRWDVDLGFPVFLAAVYLDMQAQGAGRPSIAFLALAAYGLWLVVKLRPHGLHNLLPTIAALAAAFGFAGVQNGASIEQWEIRGLTVTLAGWAIAGLFDARTLVGSLPRRRGHHS